MWSSVTLPARVCASLLGLLDDPGRRAALSPEGSQAASVIEMVGRAYRADGGSDSGSFDLLADVGGSRCRHELLDSVEVARLLGVTDRWVRYLGRKGRLRGRQVGAQWVFDRGDVDTYRNGGLTGGDGEGTVGGGAAGPRGTAGAA